jgi:hypothetical protein
MSCYIRDRSSFGYVLCKIEHELDIFPERMSIFEMFCENFNRYLVYFSIVTQGMYAVDIF